MSEGGVGEGDLRRRIGGRGCGMVGLGVVGIEEEMGGREGRWCSVL